MNSREKALTMTCIYISSHKSNHTDSSQQACEEGYYSLIYKKKQDKTILLHAQGGS